MEAAGIEPETGGSTGSSHAGNTATRIGMGASKVGSTNHVAAPPGGKSGKTPGIRGKPNECGENTTAAQRKDSRSGTESCRQDPVDPRLAQLIALWPALDESIKQAIDLILGQVMRG